MTTAIQKNGWVRSRIFRAYGPRGLVAFCLLSGRVPPPPASTAAAIATAATIAARRNRWVRSNISLSTALSGGNSAGLYSGLFSEPQLCHGHHDPWWHPLGTTSSQANFHSPRR